MQQLDFQKYHKMWYISIALHQEKNKHEMNSSHLCQFNWISRYGLVDIFCWQTLTSWAECLHEPEASTHTQWSWPETGQVKSWWVRLASLAAVWYRWTHTPHTSPPQRLFHASCWSRCRSADTNRPQDHLAVASRCTSALDLQLWCSYKLTTNLSLILGSVIINITGYIPPVQLTSLPQIFSGYTQKRISDFYVLVDLFLGYIWGYNNCRVMES